MKTTYDRDPHKEYPMNLPQWFWDMCRKDSEFIEFCDSIKEVIEKGLIAKVKTEVLNELQFVTLSRNNRDKLLHYSWHWDETVNCINMFCHTRSQTDTDKSLESFINYRYEGYTRFSKSPIDLPPIYGEHAIRVPCPGKSWNMWVRKNEVKDIRAPRDRKNYQINGIPETGTGFWDKSRQGELFNIH
jgi:hypothetical protein